MNVNELLDTIEDALEEGANVPLSGGKTTALRSWRRPTHRRRPL